MLLKVLHLHIYKGMDIIQKVQFDKAGGLVCNEAQNKPNWKNL